MKMGLIYEQQLPRPWSADSERRIFHETLDQAELADKLGYDFLWQQEHHFLEEYSHSSAPDMFLAAASQRTKRIRLAHGVMLMPTGYTHPARAAERIATLDVLSNGRAEFGTGESASRAELEGFGISPAEKGAMWREATEQAANMMVMNPYPGFTGKYFSMPCRNVVPKPIQKPHPPMWLACSSRKTVEVAARLGVGALTFAFNAPSEARKLVDRYYEIFKSECVPIGHTVNPQVALCTAFACDRDGDAAVRRGTEAFQFFGFALGFYYAFGTHKPGRSDIWAKFEMARPTLAPPPQGTCFGTPERVIETMRAYEDSGVDQMVFIANAGRMKHEETCESLQLFASTGLPEFAERDRVREEKKRRELEPYVEAAMARKVRMSALPDDEIPEFKAGQISVLDPLKKS